MLLSIETVQLEGPKTGEVMVEIKATGIVYTDESTLSGADPEGIFLAILGHEGAGVVVEVGRQAELGQEGRSRHPAVHAGTPPVRVSLFPARPTCARRSASTQGEGLMPDGQLRASRHLGTTIHHYMGTSTFANYTVLPEIAVARIREDAPFDKKVCYIGPRRDYWHRRGDEHRQGRARSERGVLRPRRHRPQRDPGRPPGRPPT